MARRRGAVRRPGAQRLIPLGAVAAGVLVIAAIVLILWRGRAPSDQAIVGADDSAAAIGQVATGPARDAEGVFARLGAMWDAAGRVRALEAENRDLRSWRDMAQRLAERNARFEALLRMPPDAFGAGADLTRSIAAQVVLDSGGPFTRTLVANAGAEHGVRVGFIAVNENGLVGRVVSVGRRSSRILMLDDYNSRVPVMGAASRVRALAAGQSSRPPELLTQPTAPIGPRLEYMEQDLRDGERVITSGDGGVYPRGLTVGYAHRLASGEWRLTPSAAQSPIDFVRIAPYDGLETPEREGVVADPGPPVRRPAALASAPEAPRRATATPAAPRDAPPSLAAAPEASDAPPSPPATEPPPPSALQAPPQ
ncbi:MAG: rod shape-determining protein MreC [Hyphomonadaceae bacterium]|nr:rod shape-determining protein MreC [Hyphomonadaceae bacterium]